MRKFSQLPAGILKALAGAGGAEGQLVRKHLERTVAMNSNHSRTRRQGDRPPVHCAQTLR
ncbi:hypothetical protein WM42_1685 [Corynebacterium simulans]|nr:hypothetical protein WM42_1685 [Corynebacterium simulans]